MKNLITVLLSCFLFINVLAQKSTETTVINGKQHYVHKVKKGQTLYNISKTYNVSIEEIQKANPQIANGLKKGKKINIPFPKTDADFHIVQQGETLFGIAKEYGLSIAQVEKFNPNLPATLSVGQKINLKPSTTKPTFSDEPPTDEMLNKITQMSSKELLEITEKIDQYKYINHTVQPKETLYGISKLYENRGANLDQIAKDNNIINNSITVGQNLKIRVDKSKEIEVKAEEISENVMPEANVIPIIKKKKYKVLFLLPFMMEKNERMMNLLPNQKRMKMYHVTEDAIRFYQGALLALDSLKKSGVSFDVVFEDTKSDTNRILKILKGKEAEDLDLIIGPFKKENFMIAANYAKEKEIPIVCPVTHPNKTLFNNPYVVKFTASLPTQMHNIGKHIADNYPNENIIIVNSENKSHQYLSKLCKESIEQYNPNLTSSECSFYRKSRDVNSVKSKMIKGKTNVIILPSSDVTLVNNFLTKMNKLKNSPTHWNYDVKVFGNENWKHFQNIDYKYMSLLHVNVPTSTYSNDSLNTNFIQKYAHKYQTVPTEFSYVGFDVTYYSLIGLYGFGKNFVFYHDYVKPQLTATEVDLKPTAENSGLENQYMVILEYDNYELIPKK